MSKALMIQGTGSDVGKSFIVAGLCRAFARRGLRVRPFKPQNMSNNAAVTADGGEIGRAQAVQALACGVAPTADMNPILLKPESEKGAQIILRGKREARLTAREYTASRDRYMPVIMASFTSLLKEADLILVEGAGSPAEVNLRAGDRANMGFAEAANLPVLLVGDVRRGGAIASIIGTMAVLDRKDAARIVAFLINNFRGDVSLFNEAIHFIERRVGIPCAGIVPHFAEAMYLPAEDSLTLNHTLRKQNGRVHIAVPLYPRIANFDDLDPLRLHQDVDVSLVPPGAVIPVDADLVLLLGSKTTIDDLAFLRGQGWDVDLIAHARRGGRVLGLCGGYQMLGRMLHDPEGLEGAARSVPGLGLLDVETVLTSEKQLICTSAQHVVSGYSFQAYEMHLGRTSGPGRARPFAVLSGSGGEGARSEDGRIEGTYLHGLFESGAFRTAYLRAFDRAVPKGGDFGVRIEQTLDRLADHLSTHVDLDRLFEIAAGPPHLSVREPASSERPASPRHGGDPDDAASFLGRPLIRPSLRREWLNLSTGVNPHAYPIPHEMDEALWRCLPRRALFERLDEAARAFYHIPESAVPIAAPGTELLIHFLPLLFPFREVQIVGPTYGSHRFAWARAGHRVKEISSIEEADPSAVVLLVNPNNPDGRMIGEEALATFTQDVRVSGGLFIIDEAYGEVMPGPGAVPLCDGSHIVILRSFGKFFGLPGLRLGFAIAAEDMAVRLSEALGSWAVSGPAAHLGAEALLDEQWSRMMKRKLSYLSETLSGILSDHGFEVVGGTRLFHLIRLPNALPFFEHLLEWRIYVRIFSEHKGWIRFGLPSDSSTFHHLEQALRAWRRSKHH